MTSALGKHATLVVCLSALTMVSTRALALIDAQLLYGPRYTHAQSDGKSQFIRGKDLKLAVHVDPIPLIPIAAGLFYRVDTWDTENTFSVLGFDEFEGQQLGAEVYAWLPIDFFDLTPYAKLGYGLGNYRGKLSQEALGLTLNHAVNYGLAGYDLSFGLRWVPVTLVGFLLEFEYDREHLKALSYKVNNEKADKSQLKAVNTEATLIRVGLDVKF